MLCEDKNSHKNKYLQTRSSRENSGNLASEIDKVQKKTTSQIDLIQAIIFIKVD